MFNPIVEIFVTEAQIKFLILGQARGETEVSTLEYIYDRLRDALTSALGILGEDYGEKVLPGSRYVRWAINSRKCESTLAGYKSRTGYKLGLYFSFPANSLKLEDYLKVIGAFSPLIVVEKFDPGCVKKSPLVTAKLEGSFDEFIKRTQLSIGEVVDCIFALAPTPPKPSPVLTAMSGGGGAAAAAAELPALTASSVTAKSEETHVGDAHGEGLHEEEVHEEEVHEAHVARASSPPTSVAEVASSTAAAAAVAAPPSAERSPDLSMSTQVFFRRAGIIALRSGSDERVLVPVRRVEHRFELK